MMAALNDKIQAKKSHEKKNNFFNSVTGKIFSINTKSAFLATLFALIIVNAIIGISQLISNYYNYGAESISFASMLRMSQSKLYVSNITEIPLLISSFTPILFALFNPLIKILNLSSIGEIVFLGRLVLVIIVFIFSWLLNAFLQKNFASHYNRSFFVFSLLWFFVMFPGNTFSVRPDFLSFMFEFLAFAFFYEITFLSKSSAKSREFYLSAIFSGLAIATKQNTIGIFFGIILFLVITKKYYKALIYSLATCLTVVLILALFYWGLGERFILNVMGSFQNPPQFGIDSLVLRIMDIVQSVVFPYTLFYLLVLIGLWIISQEDIRKVMLFSCCLGTSFLIATIGQLKVGAYLNYHFGFFMLAVIPVSIAMHWIFRNSQQQVIVKPLQIAILLVVGVQLFLGLKFPAFIFANDFKNYPYQEVKTYIQANYPEGYIYAPEDHVPLHFFDRTLLGPWAEGFLNMTPTYHPYIPVIKQELSNYHFSVAVIARNGCANWQPSGIFLEETRHLNHLDKIFKKICIFSES